MRPLKREDSSDSAQLELLGGTEGMMDYSSRTTTSSLSMEGDVETGSRGSGLGVGGGLGQYSRARTHKPDKGLFDDV